MRFRLMVLCLMVVLWGCGSDDALSEEDATATTTTSTAPATDETTATTETAADDTSSTQGSEDAEEIVPDPTASPFAEVTETVQAFVDDRNLNGAGLLIVDRDDGLLYEEYFGVFDADRLSLIASASKMISAGVLLRLHEDGMLDIDAPIADQVEWAVGNPDVTPAQLLSNSSGFVGLFPDFGYAPYVCQWSVPDTLRDCGETVFTSSDDDADQIPPDTGFRYGGGQWQVAGAVAETVSGKSWAELIDEIYVQPCGVDSLGYISLGAVNAAAGYPTDFEGNPSGVASSENPSIEGGAHITASDYARLLLMHLRGGECDGKRVLSQASLDTMHADRIGAAYDGSAWVPDQGYGMGWLVHRATGRISDPGAFGAHPWLDLDDGYGAYIILEDTTETAFALRAEIEELVHTAVTG